MQRCVMRSVSIDMGLPGQERYSESGLVVLANLDAGSWFFQRSESIPSLHNILEG